MTSSEFFGLWLLRRCAEVSQTIDSIQARLSPRRLMTDAKQTVKDATVGRVKRLAHRGRNGFTAPGGEWLTEPAN
jgi:hypothetical protein